MKLSLSKKVWILVAIPLAFELGFVVAVNDLLHQAEAEKAREIHARDEAQHLSNLFRLLLDRMICAVVVEVAKEKQFSSEDFRWKADALYPQIQAEARAVRDLAKGYPEEAKIAELESLTEPALIRMRSAEEALDRGDKMSAMADWMYAQATEQRVFKAFDYLIDQQHQVEKKESAAASKKKDQLYVLLSVGAVFNIVLAAFLVYLFNRSTTTRLNSLMSNTLKLAHGQPLDPPIKGDDEIAHLDKTLSEMAQALAMAQRKERAIVDKVTDVIFSTDDAGSFTRVSPAAQRVWGYTTEDLLGMRYLKLVSPEDRERVSAFFEKIKKEPWDSTVECRFISKDGAQLDTLLSASWSTEDKTLFCVAHDITKRKQAEAMLKETEARVRQDLIAMLSHDLRSPLTAVQGFLELLSKGICGDLNEKGVSKLKAAEHNLDHVVSLIRDLLDVERFRAGKLTLHRNEIPVQDLIERSIESVRIPADELGIHIEQPSKNGARPTIYADADRVVQVMINLLSNAIKFSPKNSSIEIDIKADDEWVEVRVKDQGSGIPADLQEKIFDRFQQVTTGEVQEKGGVGLGLAICKAIVEQHGGAIGVESEEGKGSTFWFRLSTKKEIS